LTNIENPWRIWRHFPLVVLAMLGGALGIINYEKVNHSVVGSCLYALRANPKARELLGDEIYFASGFPIIHGPIDPMHGIIDVKFSVQGSKGSGTMRFRCTRVHRKDFVSVCGEAWNAANQYSSKWMSGR
jgi:cytochrome c oxidase assembly factor 1